MIKYVDLLRTEYNDDQTAIVRFKLDTLDENQEIDVENLNGYKGDYKEFLDEGEFIIGMNSLRHSIKDSGMLFLKNLQYEFKGSIIRATDVQALS